MAQSKVNRKLANSGVNFTDIDIKEGYATQSKQKANSLLHGRGENNMLPPQIINRDHEKEALTGVTTAMSLPSPPKNNSTCTNHCQNSTRMKCSFHHKQNCFLDYFKDAVLDGAVIYVGDVLLQFKLGDSRYTEFVGNPTGNVFVATNRDHKFLLSHKDNASNIPNSSNNFRKLNFVENSSNHIQMTPPNPGYTSHPAYDVKKRC